jgi:hypothetical protein
LFQLDGNLFEIATFLVAILFVIVNIVRRHQKENQIAFNTRSIGNDFLNGASIVPFSMLIFSLFSNGIMAEILKSKVPIAIAGGLGLIFALGELFRD